MNGASFARFSDLPAEDAAQAISGEIEPVLRKYSINSIIMKEPDADEREEHLLRAIGRSYGFLGLWNYKSIDLSPMIDRVFDNGGVALYNYATAPYVSCEHNADILKKYSVPFQMHVDLTRLYFLNSSAQRKNRKKSLVFVLENDNTSARFYSITVFETSLHDVKAQECPPQSSILFSREIELKASTREVIRIPQILDVDTRRFLVFVKDLRYNSDYYIYRNNP